MTWLAAPRWPCGAELDRVPRPNSYVHRSYGAVPPSSTASLDRIRKYIVRTEPWRRARRAAPRRSRAHVRTTYLPFSLPLPHNKVHQGRPCSVDHGPRGLGYDSRRQRADKRRRAHGSAARCAWSTYGSLIERLPRAANRSGPGARPPACMQHHVGEHDDSTDGVVRHHSGHLAKSTEHDSNASARSVSRSFLDGKPSVKATLPGKTQ